MNNTNIVPFNGKEKLRAIFKEPSPPVLMAPEPPQSNESDLFEAGDRYDLIKRTLPGLGSRTVIWNVSDGEANMLMTMKVLKQGIQPDDSLIFYDKVSTNATIEEKDPLYNPEETRQSINWID